MAPKSGKLAPGSASATTGHAVVLKTILKKKPAAQPEKPKVTTVQPEPVELEEKEEEPVVEEESGEDEAEDEDGTATANTPSSKDYYNFYKQLPNASPAVQKAVAEVKKLHHRGGKQKKLAQMAMAFAAQKWDHQVFKSMETLENQRRQDKQDKAIPGVLMRAKCGGEEFFKQATHCTPAVQVSLALFSVQSLPMHCVFLLCCLTLHRH